MFNACAPCLHKNPVFRESAQEQHRMMVDPVGAAWEGPMMPRWGGVVALVGCLGSLQSMVMQAGQSRPIQVATVCLTSWEEDCLAARCYSLMRLVHCSKSWKA